MGSSEPGTWGDGDVTAPERTHEEAPTLAPGTVVAGRYEILRVIGEGGMGEVYLARHQRIDKLVAIKLLSPDRARRPRMISRFLQEAKATSKIRHEHIVDITDFGEVDGLAFFVMEYLEGEDLSVIAKREGRLPWARAKALTVQILKGLGAAHELGIIHRDVKPHNCFVSPRERNPEFVKIIDFGIAKLRDGESEEQLTQTGAIMGTADYMSPEQAQGVELDGRSDLYSVGIILYRLLVGRVPFKAGNPMATVFLHVHNAPEPPSAACPEAGLGRAVDALVLKALAKDPAERFATAGEFIEALRAVEDAGAGASRSWSAPKVGGVVAALALGAAAIGFVATSGTRGAAPEPAPAAGAAAVAVRRSPPTPRNDAVAATDDAARPVEVATPTPTPTLESASGSAPRGDAAAPEEAAVEGAGAAEADVEPGAVEPAAASVPARRSQRSISRTLARLNGKVTACGKKAGLFAGENVTVTVSIATQGKASRVEVNGTHAKAGVDCITKAIKRARFGPAQRSQTATHRYKI